MSNEVMVRPGGEVAPPLSANGVREQVNLIQEVMKTVMIGPSKDNPEGVHYGVVPGTGKKPSLYKAGAEKLSLVFRLRPIMNDEADVTVVEMGGNGHREYRVKCHILAANGVEIATGVGSCSTMESKYRYRREASYEILEGENIPKDYREKKSEYRDKGFGAKQVDGVWCWVKYSGEGRKENPDIADTYNTVLKMAKKRAYVDGILSATAASDIFTQDIEDLPRDHVSEWGKKPATPSEPAHGGVQRKSEASKPPAADASAHGDDKGGASREAMRSPSRETVRALVESKYATRGKFMAYKLDNGLRVQTDSEAIAEKMDEAGRQKAPVDITFDAVVDGKFTNRNIVEVVIHEGSAE